MVLFASRNKLYHTGYRVNYYLSIIQRVSRNANPTLPSANETNAISYVLSFFKVFFITIFHLYLAVSMGLYTSSSGLLILTAAWHMYYNFQSLSFVPTGDETRRNLPHSWWTLYQYTAETVATCIMSTL